MRMGINRDDARHVARTLALGGFRPLPRPSVLGDPSPVGVRRVPRDRHTYPGSLVDSAAPRVLPYSPRSRCGVVILSVLPPRPRLPSRPWDPTPFPTPPTLTRPVGHCVDGSVGAHFQHGASGSVRSTLSLEKVFRGDHGGKWTTSGSVGSEVYPGPLRRGPSNSLFETFVRSQVALFPPVRRGSREETVPLSRTSGVRGANPEDRPSHGRKGMATTGEKVPTTGPPGKTGEASPSPGPQTGVQPSTESVCTCEGWRPLRGP